MNIIARCAAAAAAGGKPVWQQVTEIIRLRLRRNPLGISEYFDYCLWDKSVRDRHLDDFIGWRQSSKLDARLNADTSRVLANDKLVNYQILRVAGLPIPEPIATYSPTGRRVCNEPVLRSLEDVKSFLEDSTEYPFYSKPISAGYGRGVAGVAYFDGEVLTLLDGSKVSFDEYSRPFVFPPFGGILFQKRLVAHPTIASLTGSNAVSCIRMICLTCGGRFQVHTAFWKVTTGRNMMDNFSHGRFGNCLAAIELDSGRVSRAIRSIGPGGQINNHPGTGNPLIGFRLPHWEDAIRLVEVAAANFPGLHLQNWDVALCPEGPILVELNTESELAVPQAISGTGIMDERFRVFLADFERWSNTMRYSVSHGPPQ